MFKKSLTRQNFASPSSQLFCNLIKIVKADPLPDPLSQLCWRCAKVVHLSFLCVGRYYLCYFPQDMQSQYRTNVYTMLRPIKKSCLNFARRQTCLVAINSPLPPPLPKQAFKLNPLRLFYFTQEGFIWQFCDCFTDIDECETDNGNCQEQCNNTLGSYFCECGAGFALQPDERTCGGKAHAQLLSSRTNNHCQKLCANFSQRRTCVVAIITSKKK